MSNTHPARNKILIVLAALVIAGVVLVYVFFNQAAQIGGVAFNYFRTLTAPAGTLETELAPGSTGATVTPSPASTAVPSVEWPNYNQTLTSERFSLLSQINKENVNGLKVLCTYDTRQFTSFEDGLIVVNGSLIGTTEHDIFSIDPANCHEHWRTHEDYTPASPLSVNRGAAYLDGMLFRGTEDGRVLAYDFKTGKRLWATTVADPKLGETTPAAPIAWGGLVFIGNAGGDNKGVKGRMYALDAKTGKIAWEFYLVPKSPGDITRGPQGTSPLDTASWGNGPATPITGGGTWTSYSLDPATGLIYIPGGNPAPDFAVGPRPGENLYSGSVVVLDAKTGAYQRHFKLVPKDWHDYDVSSAPTLIRTRGGKQLLAEAPKDGHLYAFDLASNALLYSTPVDRIENADVPFETGKTVHFCPGAVGGAEWNGAAYDPETNLILTGEDDWCSTVKLQDDAEVAATKLGQPWSGNDTLNPADIFGTQDPKGQWAGWLYATDADTGAWTWRVKTNYPILGATTPTAGGLVFFGDMGGNFYALDAATGQKLWSQKLHGGLGGGVITYTVNGAQKIAVAAGFTGILWPTEQVTAKVMVFGLGDTSIGQ
jgi:alcohol dehydrogenase (cytochrome c)